MEEYRDPKEIALEVFIKKKREKEHAEATRITEMLHKGGLTTEYFHWQEKLNKKEFKEITGEEWGFLSEVGKDKLKIYYARNIIKTKE